MTRIENLFDLVEVKDSGREVRIFCLGEDGGFIIREFWRGCCADCLARREDDNERSRRVDGRFDSGIGEEVHTMICLPIEGTSRNCDVC